MRTFICILSIIALISCSKGNNNEIDQNANCIEGLPDNNINANQIIGEWKLTKSSSYLFVNDYSNENIIYNFLEDGELIVSGGGNIGGYPNGTYNYVFELDYLSNSESPNEPMIWLVKIDGLKWTYNSKNNLMVIGQSYVDGADMCFENIAIN